MNVKNQPQNSPNLKIIAFYSNNAPFLHLFLRFYTLTSNCLILLIIWTHTKKTVNGLIFPYILWILLLHKWCEKKPELSEFMILHVHHFNIPPQFIDMNMGCWKFIHATVLWIIMEHVFKLDWIYYRKVKIKLLL